MPIPSVTGEFATVLANTKDLSRVGLAVDACLALSS